MDNRKMSLDVSNRKMSLDVGNRKKSLDKASSDQSGSGVKRFFKEIFIGKNSKRKDKEPENPNTACFSSESLIPWRDDLRNQMKNRTFGMEYDMDHPSRGKVYIFNHMNFKKNDRREGTDKDVQNLKESLPKIGFKEEDIKCFTDLTMSQIDDKLDEISNDDHSNDDLIMFFVLTHGEQDGKIHAYDSDYSVKSIWRNFTPEKCQELAGKPKIFFIIACRGNETDEGARLTVKVPQVASLTETDAVPSNMRASYTIPQTADFLIVYSTMEGYLSYRNPQNGTWFVQAFCQELKNYKHHTLHFLDFLTAVSRRVAIQYSTCNNDPKYNNKKQCPFITSSLTKLIYFNIKENENIIRTDEAKHKQRPKSLNN